MLYLMQRDSQMRTLADIRARTPKHEIFRGQFQHAMIAALITAGACSLLARPEGSYLVSEPKLIE